MSVLSYVKRPRHAVDDVLMADIRSRLAQPRSSHRSRAAGIYRAGRAPQWATTAEADQGGEDDGDRDEEAAAEEEEEEEKRKRRTEEATEDSSAAAELARAALLPLPCPDPLDEASAVEAAAERRRRALARRLASRAEVDAEAEPPPVREGAEDEGPQSVDAVEEDDEDSGDESGASQSSSSSSSPPPRLLFVPVFRRAAQRSTLRDGDEDEGGTGGQGLGEEDGEEERERRRELSLSALQRSMAREEEREARKAAGGLEGEQSIDDGDEGPDGEAAERELDEWKMRELRRIQRERSAAELWKTAMKEGGVQRLTGDGDGETEAEVGPSTAAAGSDAPSRYLQRYFHRGAFFADERAAEPKVFSRDFQQPTGDDRSVGDRRLLPKVLQVKRFGLKGSSKYTTLQDQDTSRRRGGEGADDLPPPAREVGTRGYRGLGVGKG